MSVHFINRYTRQLPGESSDESHGTASANFFQSRQIHHAAWSAARPTPVSAPRMLVWNDDLAATLGLDLSPEQALLWFSGNEIPEGAEPYAACYGGHQFGSWAGQLGDGRVINLGEISAPDGQGWTLQLKGAGPTPFSRHADGRAVLRSSLREYLCSEAMFHLGVPTTRALSLVVTGDTVVRDMFYDGNPAAEPGAIACRVAPGFMRFGHFELPAMRGDFDLLRQLLHFDIACAHRDLNALLSAAERPAQRHSVYLQWFSRICDSTLDLIIHWQRVGFVHGVMNTDNMSCLGLTLDFGPYGWLEDYDPDWTPNTTDAAGKRYAFGQQGAIARWNLVRLGNALAALLLHEAGEIDALQARVDVLTADYQKRYTTMLADKLGLVFGALTDSTLQTRLETLLRCQETDMTLFFRGLADFDPAQAHCRLSDCVVEAFYDGALKPENAQLYAEFEAWYRAAINTAGKPDKRVEMNAVNPLYVPRNYLAQLAIDNLMAGDRSYFDNLLKVLRNPYQAQTGCQEWAARRPDWARSRAGCSMLSCSS